MLSILEPGVANPNFTPLSYTRLNSTYLQQKHGEPLVHGQLCVVFETQRERERGTATPFLCSGRYYSMIT